MKLTAEQIRYCGNKYKLFENLTGCLEDIDFKKVGVWNKFPDKEKWMVTVEATVDIPCFSTPSSITIDIPYCISNEQQREELGITEDSDLNYGYLQSKYNKNSTENRILKQVDEYLQKCGASENSKFDIFEQTWFSSNKGFVPEDENEYKDKYTQSLVVVCRDLDKNDYYIFSDGELLYNMHLTECSDSFMWDIFDKEMADQKEYTERYTKVSENQ